MTEGRLHGPALCRALSDLTDVWLTQLLGEEPGVALVAVGGYGRRELCPGSDLDLVLLHQGRKDIAAVADRVWYPVWDARLSLDHSVRTPNEALTVAGSDLKAVLGFLDGRLVAGDGAVAAPVLLAARRRWTERARSWLPELRQSIQARHEQFDEVAFLLEPDLKEGRGGLRDVTAVRAVVTALELAWPEELDPAYETLLTVRAELHRSSGRSSDVLTLQDQDAVAAALGRADADALVAEVAGAARTISRVSDAMWRRVESRLSGPRLRTAGRERPLAAGVVLRDGEVWLTADADVTTDLALPMRAAVAAAETQLPLAPDAMRRIAAWPGPGAPWPSSVRDGLVALLSRGHSAVPVLEALDAVGALTLLLPEWAAVRNRPQRNAYHRFTVDRHLCEAAAEAAALAAAVDRPDLLLIGTWLHDIGKGFPGDHTEVGMTVVREIAARMGFPGEDAAVLVAMVEHHLLLPDVATRRDLEDPATAAAVAAAAGSVEVLELLAALTVADSRATGPAAWGDWKAGLVTDLVRRARDVLAGHRPAPAASALPDAHRALVAAGRLAVTATPTTVMVVAPDRAGLFWRVAGTLALHGLDVRSATAALHEGMAVETFDVASSTGREPDADRLQADLERALAGRLAIAARLSERARAYAGVRRPLAAAPVTARVEIDNDASSQATLVEVRAADEIGALYRIARALADCDLDVRQARITTIGPELVDVFYVVDAAGERVTDAEHVGEIRKAVLAAVSP